MEKIKVSIIVAAYNIEDYIERCLDSLVNQTLKDIEIIVVNDGSTDNTCLKVEQFSNKDDRIVLINQENKGSIEARKIGLNRARGKYILCVDGDDWLETNALEILYNNAELNSSDIVLYQAFKTYGNEKNVFKTYDRCKQYSLEELLLGKIRPTMWSKFIKLDYIYSNNIQFPSNISFAEDLAASCALFIFNPKVSIENTPLYNYYIRSTSITNTINSKVVEISDAFSFIKKILKENKIDNQYHQVFESLVYKHIFQCILTYAQYEKKYSFELYQKYKQYNIKINVNPYIKETISGYPLSLQARVKIYNQSYKLGRLYDQMRKLVKRG